MTNKEAIMLLNPKTTASALAEIEYYNGFSGKEACIEAIEDACRLAIEALTEAEQYKLALFAAIRNSTVMPAGVKLGKNMHEINKMSVETMHEVLKMCDFEKLRESYKDGEEE